MTRTNALLLGTLACLLPAASGQSIQYNQTRKIWLLSTRTSSYAIGAKADGSLRHLYWGAPLWRMDDLAAPPDRRELSSFDPPEMLKNDEYPAWGGTRYYEPSLKIVRENGDRDLVLRYASHQIRGNELDIELKDIRDDIRVTLHYRVYPEYGILRRSSTVRNATGRAHCRRERAIGRVAHASGRGVPA